MTEAEPEQVKSAYAVKNRSWKKVIRGRTVSVMGRFKLSGNKEKIKAAARSMEEREQSLKRKESESMSPHDSSIQRKRSKTPHGVDDSNKKSISTSTVAGLSVDKGKGIVGTSGHVRSNSSPLRLSYFFEEIKKSLSKSFLVELAEGCPNIEQKFRMSFDKTAEVSFTF